MVNFSHSLCSSRRLFHKCYAVCLLACLLAIFSTVLAFVFSGCAFVAIPANTEGCKIRTYVNRDFSNYISARFNSHRPVRVGILPFDVQETFAPFGNDTHNFGRDIARTFQSELLTTGELSIVEVFNAGSWPGKREEYFVGNYRSIELARGAGYDLLIVGHMEEIRGDEELNVYTKIIDVSNNVTIWYAKTIAYSQLRTWRRTLADVSLLKDRPEDFVFPKRLEKLAECTVQEIFSGEEVP